MAARNAIDNNSSGIAEATGLIVVAAVAMGLLVFGYNTRGPSDVMAQGAAPASATTTGASTENPATSKASGNNPSTALGATPQTQQRAPGNDTPSAPTSSTTGTGANAGSTGSPTEKK